MKNIICKGEKPQLMTIKKKNAPELLNNMDITKQQTKLQKEVEKQQKTHKEAMEEKRKAEEAERQANATTEIKDVDESESDSDKEERPTGIVQPKYKVVPP